MRLLFISAWFPYPPDNGSRIRAYNLIKSLARRHEVNLVSLLQDDSDPSDAVRLEEFCRVISLHPSRWFKPGSLKSLAGFLSPKPRSYLDTFDLSIRDAVADAIGQVSPDVVVASQLGAMVYVPADCPAPVLFEEVEIGSMHRPLSTGAPLSRIRARMTFVKHRNLVRELLWRCSAYTCVSGAELELVNGCCKPSATGHVVQNGVDTAHYTPDNRCPVEGALLYNGALTYGANLDAVRYFASRIYPMLRKAKPGIKLRVTGRTTGVDLTGVADCPGVEFTGYVEDIRDVLRTSAVCVVPLRQGGGSRLKILEAMAAGVPIVSTSVGAEGLQVQDGRHLLLADTAEGFAHAVERVLTEPDLARGLSAEARRLVEERYDWLSIGESASILLEAIRVSSPARLLE